MHHANRHCKKKWNTKEDKDKSMMSGLYVMRYAKRHILGRSDVEQCPIALAIVELHLPEGIRKAGI